MKEECLICKAPLEYLETDELMECAICHKKDVLEAVAKEQGVPFKAIHLQSKSEAQNAPTPITTYAFFRDGEYLTNEQMNDKRFLKVING